MRNTKINLFFIAVVLLVTVGTVNAGPISCDFSDWPFARTSIDQMDMDTGDTDGWLHGAYGITFRDIYMYYIDAFNSAGCMIDKFLQSDSDTLNGTPSLSGDDSPSLALYDDGGCTGISTLHCDYDGLTDGANDDTAPVPEPATMFLLGTGLLGLSGLKKKKK